MTAEATAILGHLQTVASERRAREADAGLAARVAAVKQYQHARFSATYADMLAEPRFSAAARFFLDDLYGPADFSERDAQFVRVVPALVRLFPPEIVATVHSLAALHALSESLDTRMAQAFARPVIDAAGYAAAWCVAGTAAEREKQIALMLAVGTALDRYTRKLLLRQSLRLMRGPARAAGMGALQEFLEKGFDTFRAMAGAQQFLDTIAERERLEAARLFGNCRQSSSVPAAST